MTTWQQVRARNIGMMHKSCQTLGHILQNVSQETATTLRDGADGWTVVEVVCHLRDFDEIFYQRAVRMWQEEMPALSAHDHEQMAIDLDYNSQNLAEVYNSLVASRQRFTQFFAELDDDGWENAGIHPERDSFDMTDAVMQVVGHDLTHLEQITRILLG